MKNVPRFILISLSSDVLALGMLWLGHGPHLLRLIVLTYFCLAIVMFTISSFWKISMHMAGVGGFADRAGLCLWRDGVVGFSRPAAGGMGAPVPSQTHPCATCRRCSRGRFGNRLGLRLAEYLDPERLEQ